MATDLDELINSKAFFFPPFPFLISFSFSSFSPLSSSLLVSFMLLETVSVITNDGRNIVGRLRGYDRAINIILEDSHERAFSSEEGVEQIVLGLYVVRGDNMAIVGELDAEKDASLNLDELRAEPLGPILH